jgi:hypothetical protein
VETGIIRQLPSGEFIEETAPVDEEARAVLESRPDYEPLPDLGGTGDVPAPGMRGAVGKIRTRLYNLATESVPLPEGNGHHAVEGNGHGQHAVEGNGHAAPAEVSSGPDAPPADGEH